MVKRILKVIAWILMIAVIFFTCLIIRNTFILIRLNNSVNELNNNIDNMYKGIKYINNPNVGVDLDVYKKDDVTKVITTLKDGSTVMTEYSYPDIRNVYTETKDEKFFYEEKENIEPTFSATIENYFSIIDYGFIVETVLNTKIKNVNLDGIECYEFTGNNSPILGMYGSYEETSSLMLYVEKDTGMPVKYVETVEFDTGTVDYIIDYEYKFDVVTDEDIREPDKTEYKKNM